MKDYWKDAPEWALWIGWNRSGEACYFDNDPYEDYAEQWVPCPQHDDINKAGQLEKRPEEEL